MLGTPAGIRSLEVLCCGVVFSGFPSLLSSVCIYMFSPIIFISDSTDKMTLKKPRGCCQISAVGQTVRHLILQEIPDNYKISICGTGFNVDDIYRDCYTCKPALLPLIFPGCAGPCFLRSSRLSMANLHSLTIFSIKVDDSISNKKKAKIAIIMLNQ